MSFAAPVLANLATLPVVLLAMAATPAPHPPSAPSAEPDALIAPPFGLSRVYAGPEAEESVRWWRAARFGMFIHFGVYAIPGRGEWVMWNESIPHREYAKLAEQFTPSPDAQKQWAATAKAAGMKYMVMTARHHDGFSLFDSHANAFNTVKTAAKQDIVRQFVDAARGANMRVGLYYSPLDWRFPGYFFPDLYLESAEAMQHQYAQEIDQLSRDYGKIDLVWYDGGGEAWLGFGGIDRGPNGWRDRDRKKPYQGKFSWHDDEVNAKLRQLQPGILINDRTTTHGDWRTREGAQHLGNYENAEPWELCVTLAGAWGYQPQAKPRSLEELVLMITRTASRDGNLLLNVGPAPSGFIPDDQVECLRELGRWLETYGPAIYDTRGGPFLPTEQLSATRRDNSIFVHVLHKRGSPRPTKVLVPVFVNGPTLVDARDLASDRQVSTSIIDSCLQIDVPQSDATTVVVKLTYDASVMKLPANEFPAQP